MYRSWRRQRILRRARFDDTLWQRVCAELALLEGLPPAALQKLRELLILFLHEKQVSAAVGLEMSDAMRYHIGAQACLLILELGLEHYAGWQEVIVYPDEFLPAREYVDEAGVVHTSRYPLAGEAWSHGPVILSWADARSSVLRDGANVVIHEFAHKLDMHNGAANGFPALHRDMRREAWVDTFRQAYEDFCRRVDADEDTLIDPYASESPAEFFAVLSEVFFETPHALKQCYSGAYEQMRLFYRQDPASRLAS